MKRSRPAAGRHPRLVVTVVAPRGFERQGRSLARWLERAAPPRARGAVAIAFTTDRAMRQLNLAFRGVNAATDVLSFPAGEARRGPASRSGGAPDRRSTGRDSKSFNINSLGDVAIALGVARRQARAERHSLETELKILALHGLLHLIGYDHERDQGHMQRAEERLRRRAGLPTGLIARAPHGTPDR
jgi:probable rRNA maturation factor